MKTWLKRKKAALCILAGICAVSIYIILDSKEKIYENKGGCYVVKIRHYGVNAKEMEAGVTIPLEDALFAIPGAVQMQSSSENSLSSVFIRFNSKSQGHYEAVRDAVQRVYQTLPSSAQRPEILSSGDSGTFGSRTPVWSCAVHTEDSNAAQALEKTVKPSLESLEGAGEVVVSGVGNKQIFIILDQEKLSAIGLDAQSVAMALGTNDSVFSGGSIIQNNREIIVMIDGRLELENALIPLNEGKFAALADIAVITEREREPDILSRLNGKKTAGIAVMSRDGANLQKLSTDIKKTLASLDLPELEFAILSDLGAEEAKAFRSVLNAALSGAFMVALISFLLNKIMFRGIVCALSIPIICLISAALLLLGGISLDRLMLAGIAAGVGTAVDAVILSTEKIRLCANYASAAKALKELAPPLAAGSATTVIALLPLAGINDESVKIIALSIAVVCLVALAISLALLPPLLLWKKKPDSAIYQLAIYQLAIYHFKKYSFIARRISRGFYKLLAANVNFCKRRPAAVIGAAVALTAAAVFALFNKGADTASYGSEDSIYAQVEFDGGLLPEETDRLLAAYGLELSKHPGIKNAETGARTGSGSLLISFDPKITQARLVRAAAKQIAIPGGFIFFHENSSRERYWEIKIYGDEDAKCRELAEELAFICSDVPLIKDTVLNFKQGSKKLLLLPDREIFAEAGISFSAAANNARSGVYGPVAYKRVNETNNQDGEIDVRILTSGASSSGVNFRGAELRPSKEETLNILVSNNGENGSYALRIDTLMKKREETEPSGIRRDDRRRTASITILTSPMDPRRVKKELRPFFEKIELPPGYSIEFDPEAIKQAQSLSATVLSLVMAVLFCYMILAAINESFTVPLIALAAIPASLAIPALCLALSGSSYNTAIACAFIAVSGMTVNASVLCLDELKKSKSVYRALRKKIPALLATTATTVAGAVPFLFLKEGANNLIRTLSLVGALGVACSFVCSMTVIPSIVSLARGLKNNFKNIRSKT